MQIDPSNFALKLEMLLDLWSLPQLGQTAGSPICHILADNIVDRDSIMTRVILRRHLCYYGHEFLPDIFWPEIGCSCCQRVKQTESNEARKLFAAKIDVKEKLAASNLQTLTLWKVAAAFLLLFFPCMFDEDGQLLLGGGKLAYK